MSDLQKLHIDRSRPRRSPRRFPGGLFSWIGLLVAIGLVILFWPTLSSLVDRIRLPAVDVVRVERSHPADVGAVKGKAANGYVVAARRAALSADTPGRIVELNVTEGSVVRKGDVVARLYSEEYEAALKRAEIMIQVNEATVERAKAEVEASGSEHERSKKVLEAATADAEQAEASRALAVKELARFESLLASRVGTQQEVDRAIRDRDEAVASLRSARATRLAAEAAVNAALTMQSVSRADLEVARARVEAERAARDLARATLEKTEVRAPFDGVVVLKDAEVGEVVSPNSQGGSNARGSVCTMVDFASLEVQADVPETSLSAVALGAPARIFLDAYADRPYEGSVARIWPTANRQKATIEVRIKFDRPDDLLRPEMGVRVVFLEGDAGEASSPDAGKASRLLVPEESVVTVDGRRGVFLVERDRALFRNVECGEERGGKIVIESGLTEGTRIVLDPPATLQDEDRVRVQERR